MFTANPFTALNTLLTPGFMQGYIVLMLLAVVFGTLYDVLHDKKLTFFRQDRRHARAATRHPPDFAALIAIVAKTISHDIATFGEFCNWQRRVSHVLMFYGFVLYVVSTVMLVFGYASVPAPPLWPLLWHLGALLTLLGGYWFFLFLRVNVTHDGHSRWRLVRADLFIVLLLASVTFALLFDIVALAGNLIATGLFAALYLLFTTLLFVTVPWSKFAHMFYKPVVALQRRVEDADGSSSLPEPTSPGGKRCPPSHT